MATIVRLFLLPLCLSLALQAASATPKAIDTACKQTGSHHDVCVKSLSSDPKSKGADLNGLAAIAIGLAARKAAGVADLVGKREEEATDSGLQNCLTDCVEEYEDAVDQLEGSRRSMDDKKYEEVIMFVEAAMADVKTCQKGCQAVPEHKNVLTQENKEVSQMCSISLSITRMLQSSHH